MSDINKRWKAHQFDWNVIAEEDTEKNYILCINQRESAMLLGALTPTLWRTRWLNLPESEDLQWIVDLKAKLLENTLCCDAVEICIESSEGIREIIKEIIREYTTGDPSREIGGGNPVFDSCNSDIIFGAVTSLVDYLNAQIIDALEIIEVASNPIEAINLWADNLPFAGQLASALIEAINWIQENIEENYLANYTTGLRDTYRCDLFCLWKESPDCKLTPAMVAGYFGGRIGSPDLLQSLNDVLQFLFTGVWAGSQIVDTMHVIALASLVATDAIGFFDLPSTYSFDTAVALGANSPDPDWAILCEDCNEGEWCRYFDFTTGQHGWQSLNIGVGWGATYSAGVGWLPVNNSSGGSNNKAASIGFNFAGNTNIIHDIEFYYDIVKGTYSSPTDNLVSIASYSPYSLLVGQPYNISPDGANLTGYAELEHTFDNYLSLIIRPSRTTGTPNGSVVIKGVTLRGTGTPPLEGDVCT
uniref:Uncharacterized protein n=1 Tax=uncultured prokaryote TaxID=198431 RepID=A0A0H5QQF8_9ZZZZ|nr:hypothetical protein [uncultured prokaryote]